MAASGWRARACFALCLAACALGADVGAGGGGYALRFRTWPRRDIVGSLGFGKQTALLLTADGITIEFWFQMIDDNVHYQTVLAYAVEVPQSAACVPRRAVTGQNRGGGNGCDRPRRARAQR